MHCIHRNRKQRPFLPLESVPVIIAFEPDFGRTTAFDGQINFFVEVLFNIQRAGARHFNDVTTPFALGAVQLNVAAVAAHARPWLQRQVLYFAHPNVAVNRNAFGFHEQIVRRLRTAELAEPGALEARWFMPVNLPGDLMHDGALAVPALSLSFSSNDGLATCRGDGDQKRRNLSLDCLGAHPMYNAQYAVATGVSCAVSLVAECRFTG